MSAEETHFTRLFSGLALQLVTFNHTGMNFIPAWSGLETEQRKALTQMPMTFTTLKEAAMYQAIIMQYGVRMMVHIAKSTSQPREQMFPFTVTVPSREAPELIQIRIITGHITQWWKAWEKLSKVLYANRGNIMVNSMITKMHITTLYLTLVGILGADETGYDSYPKLFQETVELAETVLKAEKESTGFCYSVGVIVPLQFTAQKCRFRSIRRKAIALLLGTARREGVWDSLLFGKMMEWGANIEEEFMENSEIPGWARVTGIGRVADLQQRTAILTCHQRTSEASDKLVKRQQVIHW